MPGSQVLAQGTSLSELSLGYSKEQSLPSPLIPVLILSRLAGAVTTHTICSHLPGSYLITALNKWLLYSRHRTMLLGKKWIWQLCSWGKPCLGKSRQDKLPDRGQNRKLAESPIGGQWGGSGSVPPGNLERVVRDLPVKEQWKRAEKGDQCDAVRSYDKQREIYPWKQRNHVQCVTLNWKEHLPEQEAQKVDDCILEC